MCRIRSTYSHCSRDVEELMNDGRITDVAFLVDVTSQVNILTKDYKVEESSLQRCTTI
jgi:hypothetical protein